MPCEKGVAIRFDGDIAAHIFAALVSISCGQCTTRQSESTDRANVTRRKSSSGLYLVADKGEATLASPRSSRHFVATQQHTKNTPPQIARPMAVLPFPSAKPAGIDELAERRLRESPYFYLKGLSCEFSMGVLTLRGCVPYEQLRRCAESIVARVDGVDEIVNEIEVMDPQLGYLRSKGA